MIGCIINVNTIKGNTIWHKSQYFLVNEIWNNLNKDTNKMGKKERTT